MHVARAGGCVAPKLALSAPHSVPFRSVNRMVTYAAQE